jgi:hypothetical protein
MGATRPAEHRPYGFTPDESNTSTVTSRRPVDAAARHLTSGLPGVCCQRELGSSGSGSAEVRMMAVSASWTKAARLRSVEAPSPATRPTTA